MVHSADERPKPAREPSATGSDSADTEADEEAGTAKRTVDAARQERTDASNRVNGKLNGLHDCSADRGEALTYPPNHSERQACCAPEGTNQPHPHGSDGSTGPCGQAREPGADVPGEGDDHPGHPAERTSEAPHRRANPT